tara:strand:- start:3613 stop:5334 length:1722 start_codon:yes stop_codon:yes gene_type:complete
MSVGDFKDGLEDFNDYINGTKVDIPTGQVDVDVNDGTITAQTQSYSLKEIICSLLAGNGIKLPNLQICLKVNLGRLIPEIPDALADLRGALEDAEKALDDFIAHTNIDNALGRLNSAVAEFAAIANMINFCGTPVVPRAIPNVLRDAMGSFIGAGKGILDTLGTMADGDIGGCIGTDGRFNPNLFTSGILKRLGDQFNNLANLPDNIKQGLIDDLNAFKTDMENLIEFENNFKGSNSTGGSLFAPTTRVNTNVGVAVDNENMTLAKSQQYASNLQSLYNSLKAYEVDANGNNIFDYLLEPELVAKLENDGSPTVPLANREPIYDHCNRVIGYTNREIQTVAQISVGDPEQTNTQPGLAGLAESGTVVTASPATTTNLGGGGSVSSATSSSSSTSGITNAQLQTTLSNYVTSTQLQTELANYQPSIDLSPYALQTQLFSGEYADLSNKPNLFDGNYNSLTNLPAIPSDISQLTDNNNLLSGSGGSYPTNPTFTSITTNNLTVTGTGNVVFTSGNNLSLTAAQRVEVTGKVPFKLATMTTVERNQIASPESGDTIYNTDTNKFQGYANGAWVNLN